MLERVSEGVWVQFHPLKVAGLVALGTRMTVARLSDGGLFLCSPVPLTDALRREVDALGPVRVICAPNKMHHLFVGAWMAAYPDALSVAAPGLPDKRKDLTFKAVWTDAPVPALAGAIEHVCLQGMPPLNEVVFFHAPSRTLIATDLALNFVRKPGDPWIMRLYYALTGAGNGLGQNAVVRSTIKDKAAMRASLERVLAWGFERIVLAHGELVLGGGRDKLRAATAWLF